MNQPTLSVALCTYNGEQFLKAQLESIAAQTKLPDELVISDDGSIDGTLNIIADFAEKAPFAVHVHNNKKRLGVAANFFTTMGYCLGDWIMLCDQDDIWLSQRIENMLQLATSYPESCLLLTDGRIVDQQLRSKRSTVFQAFHLKKSEVQMINQGKAANVLVRHVFATGAGMMVKNKALEHLPFPVNDFLHDEWLAWLLAPHLRISTEITFLYRQHGKQVTGIDGRQHAQLQRLIKPEKKASRSLEKATKRLNDLLAELTNISELCVDTNMDLIKLLKAKIQFLEKRLVLPDNRVKRVLIFIVSLNIRNYWKFGNGFRTLAKDILYKPSARRE